MRRFRAVSSASAGPGAPSYTVYPVSDSFEGTLAAKTGSHAALDTIEIYVPDTDVQYAVTYADTQTTICSLYDRAKLAEKNQYEVFFGGNHARVDIQHDRRHRPDAAAAQGLLRRTASCSS